VTVEAGGTRSGSDLWKRNSRSREARERIIKFFLTACAYLSIFTTVGIVVVLFEESIRFFSTSPS
jgi:phosphate transport system permease protein